MKIGTLVRRKAVGLALLLVVFTASATLARPRGELTKSDAVTVIPADSTHQIFKRVMALAQAERLHERPIGEVIQRIGEQFLGAPYVEGLLDASAEETLVFTLAGFDCVLFVESVLALARAVVQQDYSFETFKQHLREQRYRDGQLKGYCSRLHYFTDWIADNERRGTVRNISTDLGGITLDKTLTFMGAHRASYPHLATNEANFQCILGMEAQLADLEHIYIPQDQIRTTYDQLLPGDIIATSTHIRGLDVTHTGFVYAYPDGRKGFLHASTTGEVVIAPDLQTYVEGVKVQIGVVVARPSEARRVGG